MELAKTLFRFFLELLALYALTVALIYVFQRNLQYYPDANDPGLPKHCGLPEMEVVHVTTTDGLKLVAWFAPPKEKDGRIIVLFHGNAGNLITRSFKARFFLDHGYGVFLSEYRGYGGNPGKPTEAGLYHDGRAALQWLEEHGYSRDSLIIYGESIGTGVAVQMAFETQPKYLILEAPFSSAADIAKLRYPILPVDIMMHDRYDSIDKISKIKSEILVVHGDQDPVIPITSGLKLFHAANTPKKFCEVKGAGHADIIERGAGHVIIEWLDQHLKAEKRE